MFVLANLFQALSVVLSFLIDAMWWLVVIRALLSWVSPDPLNPIVAFVERATEPLLQPFRKILPAYRIGLDLSPVFAIVLLYFLKLFLVQTLADIALRLR